MIRTQTITSLIEVAARVFIMPRWQEIQASEITAKGDNDLVTVADTETESFLSGILQDMWPDARIIGEEAAAADPDIVADRLADEHVFVLDPLDGTKSFVRGNDNFAVMLSELRYGEVVRSWIHLPVSRETFTYESGCGVRRNGVRITCPTPMEAETPLGTKRGFVKRTNVGGVDVTHPCGSVGVAYTKILTRNLDFFIHPTMHAWDHLAGAAMIARFGGAVSVVRKNKLQPYFAGETGDALVASASVNVKRMVASTGLLK